MNALHKLNAIAYKANALFSENLVSTLLRISIFFIFWPIAQSHIYGLTVLGQDLAFWNLTSRGLASFPNNQIISFLPLHAFSYVFVSIEFLGSLFILLGFLTRFSALLLLTVVLLIQIMTWPSQWEGHLLWAVSLIALLKYGAGNISLDKHFSLE